jgi:hypothetical protein
MACHLIDAVGVEVGTAAGRLSGVTARVADWELVPRRVVAGHHTGGRRGRVVTAGRQGLFVPDNTHHVLAMGVAAALPFEATAPSTSRCGSGPERRSAATSSRT